LKDWTTSEKITVRHCPTLQMLADFLQSHCRAPCSNVSRTLSSATITHRLSPPTS
jgi:hypothetical protein